MFTLIHINSGAHTDRYDILYTRVYVCGGKWDGTGTVGGTVRVFIYSMRMY